MFEQPLKPDTPAPQPPVPQAGESEGDLSDPARERKSEGDPELHPAPPPTDPEAAS